MAICSSVLLLAWRWETLRLPPYQDQAAGYWTEASFLADSGFDYYGLRYVERHYMDEEPGPRSYMISVWPTLLALLMKATPDPQINVVVARLASFALAGCLLALVYALLRPRLGPLVPLLPVLALGTTPAFVTQVELMGLDVPLTVVMLLSAWALTKERFQTAAILGLLAFFIKATGQLMNLVGLAYCLLLLIGGGSNWESSFRRRVMWGAATNVALFALEECILLWGDTSAATMALGSWPSLLKPPLAIWITTPDLAILMALSGVGLIIYLRRSFRERGLNRLSDLFKRATWGTLVRSEPLLTTSALFVVGLLLMSRLVMYIPRYFFCGMPFLTCLWAITWLAGRGPQWLVRAALLCLVGFNLLNAEGRYFPSLADWGRAEFAVVPSYAPRTCALSERSREYLADQRATIELARVLEQSHTERPIFAESPLHFLFINSRLGYVSRPLESYDAVEYELALRQLVDVYGSQPDAHSRPDPIFVRLMQTRTTLPGPAIIDSEIWHDDLQPPLVAYVKRIPPEVRGDSRKLVEWFLDETWRPDWPVARLQERVGYLLNTRRFDRLRSELSEAERHHPDDAELKQLVADYRAALREAERASTVDAATKSR